VKIESLNKDWFINFRKSWHSRSIAILIRVVLNSGNDLKQVATNFFLIFIDEDFIRSSKIIIISDLLISKINSVISEG
jgi:hypothetical protein